MIRLYFFTYFLYLKLININCENREEGKHFNQYNILLVPKKVQIKYLNYSKNYKFSFGDNNSIDDLLVHFHSIDWNIKIINNSNTNPKINKIKKDIMINIKI